jgi:hypothetical protein
MVAQATFLFVAIQSPAGAAGTYPASYSWEFGPKILYRNDGATRTALASGLSYSWSWNTWFTMRLETADGVISATCNGTPLTPIAVDSTYTGGTPGGIQSGPTSRFDNWEVGHEAPEAPRPFSVLFAACHYPYQLTMGV